MPELLFLLQAPCYDPLPFLVSPPADDVFVETARKYTTTEENYTYKERAAGIDCKRFLARAPVPGALTLTPQPAYKKIAKNRAAIMAAVSSDGPVVIYFNVDKRLDSGFHLYSSGVFNVSQCRPYKTHPNHAMLIVGYDMAPQEVSWVRTAVSWVRVKHV